MAIVVTTTAGRTFSVESETTTGTDWESVTVPGWVRRVEVQAAAADMYVSVDHTSGARNATTNDEFFVASGASVLLNFVPGRSISGAKVFGVCTPGGPVKFNMLLEA